MAEIAGFLKRVEPQRRYTAFRSRMRITAQLPDSSLAAPGIILRTTDGGKNWAEQTSYSLPQGANAFYAVSFTDANTGTIVGEAGIILQTTDGGAQWNSQSSATFNYLYGVSFTDPNTGTVVGYQNPDGVILRTTDSGNTWVRQNSGVSDPFAGINLFGVHFINSNIGTIVGDEGIILRTTDGGSNWVQQTSGTTDLLYAVHFSDENHGAAVGFLNGKILTTTDGGENWVTHA